MRKYEPIAGITVGAAGTDSTIPVPTNRRLLLARVYATGTNAVPATVYGANVLDELKLYVGGKLQRTVTATELLYLSKLNNRDVTPSATVGIPIYFAEPQRASVMDEQVSAWDVFGVPSVVWQARTKAGITNPQIKVVVDYDDGFTTNQKGERLLNIIRYDPVYMGNLGTSADIMGPANIPLDLPIQRIHIFPDAGVTVSAVKVVKNDSETVFEMTQAENIEFLADYKMVAESGNGKAFPVCFDLNGQLFDALDPVRSLKLSLTQSGAGTIKLLLERRAPNYI